MQKQGLADLVEKLIPAVVNISSEQIIKQEKNFLSIMVSFLWIGALVLTERWCCLVLCFIINKPRFIIVTSYHVIKNAQDITITMNDNTYFTAVVLGYDARADLAVLKVHSNKDLPSVAFGNPFGLGGPVSTRITSARSRDITIGTVNEFIQTGAAINRGNSGGPLFDLNVKVIGINTAIYSLLRAESVTPFVRIASLTNGIRNSVYHINNHQTVRNGSAVARVNTRALSSRNCGVSIPPRRAKRIHKNR
ncbi:putative periplasmic serine endoprotease DegP-like [Calliopsis andreniformis]|uniref:putative periplasmic serine endoprotease DegP-like n=1 Tax=Calliopsis andreniformis TaxID=337506 RepID=UPI003FCE4004